MPIYTSIDQLPMELNIRDLGGIPTKDGRHIKKGMLFRSSALAFFNEEELAPVRALGLKTILDFRSAKGSGKTVNPLLVGAEYFNKCAGFQNIMEDLNSPGELASLVFDEDQKGNLIDVLVSSYTASLAFSNESFQFMFDRLLAGKAPLMFHCANGKDRTGVAAMLLLLALGADEKAVKEDFLMSNLNRKARIDEAMKKYRIISGRSGNARSFLTMLRGVLPEAADMMMSEILERYETYENFMDKEYGFDADKLEKFRSMYLEG